MGLLGADIHYTMSPRLHNRAAALLGINAAYLPLSMPESAIKSFLDVAWDLGALGFNVTTPHKAFVASIIPGCKLASVNTVFRGKNWWEAASTDGAGFALGLKRLGINISEFSDLIILGSGGVVAAILAYMSQLALVNQLPTLPMVHLLSRGRDCNDSLRSLWLQQGEIRFSDLNLKNLQNTLSMARQGLLIQATSAPHRGDDLSELCPALKGFSGVVSDLVYARPSALFQVAKEYGLKAQDGTAMLIEQARLAQRLWWGRAAPYEELEAALK